AQAFRVQFAVAGQRRGVQPRGFRSVRQCAALAGLAADQCGAARSRGRGREGEGALSGEVRLGGGLIADVSIICTAASAILLSCDDLTNALRLLRSRLPSVKPGSPLPSRIWKNRRWRYQ